MDVIGTLNAAQGPGTFGFEKLKRVHANLDAPVLVEEALKRGEARLAQGGALVADTGVHTGRSPKDKFIVKDEKTEGEIWWANNGAITPGSIRGFARRISSPMREAASFSSRIFTEAPRPDIAFAPASSPNMPGIRSSSAIS